MIRLHSMHEQILDALRRGAHEEATAAARQATDADSSDPGAYRLLAQALRMAGDGKGALAAIDSALAIAPEDANLHFHRAGLLLGSRDVSQAREALQQTLELDPNQLGAYLAQAQIALGSGDLDEAERRTMVAARLDPEHPVLRSVEAMITLGRGDATRALSQISTALAAAPDNVEVLNSATFIYLANGHVAFAEQAMRRLRELRPGYHALRRPLAELLFRQERHVEALEEVQPLLDMGEASPETRRFAGALALRLGDPQRALDSLRGALAAMPGDELSLDLAMQAWSRLGDVEGARNTLEALLSTSPEAALLWRARLSVETGAGAQQTVLGRWLAAHPDSPEAHHIQAGLHAAAGDLQAAEASLRKLLEVDPGHATAQARLLDLLGARDPQAAVEFARALLESAEEADPHLWTRHSWLGRAHDMAGDAAGAVRAWSEGHAAAEALHGQVMLPLPALTDADAPLSQAITAEVVAKESQAIIFLVGLPGSGVTGVVRLLDGVVPAFRADRFGTRPPADPLQRLDTPLRIADRSLDPAEVVTGWRQALAGRGLASDAPVIDYLPHWDNALLGAIGPYLPKARLLVALRDPRDMLLDWLANGAVLPLQLGTPEAAARWLASALEHIARLHVDGLHPHQLLRLDQTVNSPQAMSAELAEALGTTLPQPPKGLFGAGRFAAGHWRAYATPLAEAFAELGPVAVRLGYPQD